MTAPTINPGVKNLLDRLLNDETRVMGLLSYLSGKMELQQADFQAVVQALQEVSDSLEGA